LIDTTLWARAKRADRGVERQRVAFGAHERKFVNIHVPCPLGFFSKNVDGRIDDPNTGWKGRELWTTGTSAVFHNEGGTENRPKGL
jgi:hypothetical protein